MEKAEKKAKEGIRLTIIEKIEALMDENKVNQATLARDIDMGQALLSKCLSRKGSNYFSIDALIRISDYFNVTVDSLLGRTSLNSGSTRRSNAEICRNLINLIETNTVNIEALDIEQDTFQPNRENPENGSSPFRYEKRPVSYKTFYFSNYLPLPDTKGMSKSEKKKVESGLNLSGLYHPKGIEINAFIEYYLKLRDLYRKKELPKAFFEQAVEDRLNQMRY